MLKIACCALFWQRLLEYVNRRGQTCQTPPAFNLLRFVFGLFFSCRFIERTAVRNVYFEIWMFVVFFNRIFFLSHTLSICVCWCSQERNLMAIFDERFGTDFVAYVMRTHIKWYLKCDRWNFFLFNCFMKFDFFFSQRKCYLFFYSTRWLFCLTATFKSVLIFWHSIAEKQKH